MPHPVAAPSPAADTAVTSQQRSGRRWLGALASLLLASPALAAPFSSNPVSFAGFANESFRRQGKDVFVRNLSLCLKEGQGGYRCLKGEVLIREPGQAGRQFCSLSALWYVPFSRTVQYRAVSCRFRSDQQRLMEQGEQLLRKGLDTLENYSR